MEILILDIETTGLNHNSDCILEIGIVSLNLETGEVKEVYDSLVKEDDLKARHREAWIFSNSDLKVEDIRGQHKPQQFIYKEVQEIINQYPLGVTAYNNKFDFGFLISRDIEIKNPLPCPMILSTNICKLPGRRGSYKWPSVEEAFKHFFPDSNYDEKHRGLDDAKHEAMIVYELYKIGVFKID